MSSHLCKVCGKPITDGRRKDYCSSECRPAPRCIDCGKLISDGGAKRCNSCASIKKWANPEIRQNIAKGRKKYWDKPGVREYWSDKMSVIGNTSESKRKRSEAGRKRYSDPKERHKQSERMKLVTSDPEWRENQSRIQKERCKDPKVREKMSEASKSNWEDPCYRANVIEKLKRTCNTPEYKRKRSKLSKASWARGDHDDQFTEELCQSISERTKRLWEQGCYDDRFTEESLIKMSEANKAARARGCYDDFYTEEVRCNMSKARKKHLAKPGVRSSIGEATRRNWKDPEYRRKVLDGLKRTRRKRSNLIRLAWERGAYDERVNVIKEYPTSIEIMVSDALDGFELDHQSQWRPDGYSRVYDELVYPNILIEVQGSYWHSSPEAQENDLEKARWAHNNGYKFIAIWDFQLEEYGADFLVEKWVLPLIPTEVLNEI